MTALTDEQRNTFFKIIMHDYLTDRVGMALSRLQIHFRQDGPAPESVTVSIPSVENTYAEGQQKAYILADEFDMTIEELKQDPQIKEMVDLGNKVAEAIVDNARFFKRPEHVDAVMRKFKALQREAFKEELLNELFIEHVRTEPQLEAVRPKKN